jgi:GNAT superfamily N-acetyltransferase
MSGTTAREEERVGVAVREAQPDDEGFLSEVAALFGQELRLWGEPWDFGLIAEVDGRRRGAAWYRRYRPTSGAEQPPAFRQVFVGVHPDYQRRGIGTKLWVRLLAAAHRDDDVRCLVADIASGSSAWSERRLREFGFVRAEGQTTTYLRPVASNSFAGS